MALSKRRIGDLITVVDERNVNGFNYPFFGININKEFMPSVANTNNVDNRKYKIIKKDRFVFSGMQTGRDNCIRISIYTKNDCVLVSPAYTTFEVTSPDILPLYFFMVFNSKEKDRYGAFLSDSSVRANLDWDRFCDIEIDVPPKPIQEKYVAIYKSLLANLHSYEKGLDDLKLVCDGYIENLRKNMKSVEIANYIEERNIKNENSRIKYAIGISMNGIFESERTAKKDSIAGCKIVRKNNILWASQTTCGIGLGAVGMYEGDDDAICAPTCTIIDTKNGLNPHYLLLWLRRKEFWRYSRFVGSGVVEKFDSVLMGQVKIPIPDENIQLEIVNVYKTLENRKKFISALKLEIQNICPVLIRGSVLETNGGKQYDI